MITVKLLDEVTLKAAIQEDYRRTGQCRLTIAAKNEDGNLGQGWGMAQASPYREKFNRGYIVLIFFLSLSQHILNRIKQDLAASRNGLISTWQKWFEPNTRPCLNDNKDKGKVKSRKKKQLSRISLANMTGAFSILAIGFLISLLVFLIEKIVFYWKMNRIFVVETLIKKAKAVTKTPYDL